MSSQRENIDIDQLRKDIQSDITKRFTALAIATVLGVAILAGVGAWTLLKPQIQDELGILSKDELHIALKKYLKTEDLRARVESELAIVSKGELDAALQSYLKTEDLETQVESDLTIVSEDELDTALQDYLKAEDLRARVESELAIVSKDELDAALKGYLKVSDGAPRLDGALLIYSKNTRCPNGSKPVANILVQSRRDDPLFNETVQLREATSRFNAGSNWQGNSFSACYFN